MNRPFFERVMNETDRTHEHQVLALTNWVAGGPDYFVNGGNCVSLRSESIATQSASALVHLETLVPHVKEFSPSA
jgi:hypothetical protein